jgi:hypothetical protein
VFFGRFLAIDETDRMVEKGHFEELQHLLEMINADEEKKKLRQVRKQQLETNKILFFMFLKNQLTVYIRKP